MLLWWGGEGSGSGVEGEGDMQLRNTDLKGSHHLR